MSNSTGPFFINAVVNIPFCVITTVGNSLILVSFTRTPSLISPSNVLLIGLAISDLCVGLIGLPLFVAWKIKLHVNPTMTTSTEILGRVSRFSSSLLCAVSFLIVSCLSVDRFLAVHLHLRYCEIVTVRRVTGLVCFLWVGSVVASSLGIWRDHYFDFIAAPVACICFVVNAVLYFKIYRVVRRHQLQISYQQTRPFATEPINMTARLKYSFFNSLYLYLIFLLCNIPYIYSVVRSVIAKASPLAFDVSSTVVFTNSFLNPLFFSWRLKNVQAAVTKTIKDISAQLNCFGNWRDPWRSKEMMELLWNRSEAMHTQLLRFQPE